MKLNKSMIGIALVFTAIIAGLGIHFYESSQSNREGGEDDSVSSTMSGLRVQPGAGSNHRRNHEDAAADSSGSSRSGNDFQRRGAERELLSGLEKFQGSLPGNHNVADLAGELDAIAAETDPGVKERMLRQLLDRIDDSEIPAFLHVFSNYSKSELSQDLQLRLIRRLADIDPEAAVWWLDELNDPELRMKATKGVAVYWANKDLSAAVDWMKTLPGDARNEACRTIAYEAVRGDPRQAMELAENLPAGKMRENLLIHAASELAAEDIDAVLDWALDIEDETLFASVISNAARIWGSKNPEAAAELAIKFLGSGRKHDSAIIGIARKWVQSEPNRAAEWVVSFPAGEMRGSALKTVVNIWAEKDMAKAGEWILSLEGYRNDQEISEAMAVYANKAALQDPPLAAEFAEAIKHKESRLRAIKAVAEHWLLRDPEAARLWIRERSIPEEEKNKLLNSEYARMLNADL